MVKLYNYNEEAYSNMQEMFEEENKVAIVHPTGTGKMYIALKWLYENKDKNCLFLCPTKAIMYQLKNTIESCGLTLNDFPNLKLALYLNLLNWNVFDYEENQYDCIVMDEFHRAGAPEWEKSINKLLEYNKDAKILGLSATPTRYVDKKNMVDEMFEGNVASEITLAEAIARDILPFPNYVSCIYSFIDEINKREIMIQDLQDEKKKEYLAKLIDDAKRYLKNVIGIDDIIKNHITKKSGKYLIFCKDINHIYEMQEEVIKWFDGIGQVESYIVHSDIESEKNETTLRDFEQQSDKIKLLFSVDMLNEGLHIKDVDGVVMLRTTQSHIIFLQQLGRCLKVKGKVPLVIDIANNIEAYQNIYDIRDEILQHLGYSGYNDERVSFELKEKFKIYGYSKDIVEYLKKIDFMYRPVLSFEEMIELIKEYMEKENKPYNKIKQSDTYKDINIGNWIFNYRSKYKRGELSNEKEQILRSLGETFQEKRKDISFEEMIEIIKKWMEENRKTYLEISRYENYNGINIGEWKTTRRREYKKNKLSKEREQILRSLGETFEIKENKSNLSFEEMIELIKEYMNEFNQSYDQIKSEQIYKDINLGIWKYNQRIKYNEGRLSKEREQILRSLGETFEIKEKKPNLSFEKMIELIKEYMNEFNQSYEQIKSNQIYKDINIGIWKYKQRKQYNQGRLSKEREQILRSLGETFEIKEKKSNLSFEEMIELIKEYMNEFNQSYDQIKSNQIYKDINIGIWKYKQRTQYNEGRLSKEREQVLRSLGETFETKEKKSNLFFEKMIELIKEYMNEFNQSYDQIKSNQIYKDINIGIWKYNQQIKYNEGRLSKEREQVLRSLGETFQERRKNISFEEMIELIKEYMNEFNQSYDQIKLDQIYKDINIGNWKSYQRIQYNQGKLSKEREQILRSLGETFQEKRKNISFEEMIELIKEYMNEFNQTYDQIIKDISYKGINIGRWIGSRRLEYNQGRLSKEKEQILRSLGETFEKQKLTLPFDEMISAIKCWMEENNKTYLQIRSIDKYKDINIGTWKANQRKKYKEGKLPKDQELVLRSLGEVFPEINKIPNNSTVLLKDANLTIPSKKR